MQSNKEISEELRGLSSVVAGISRVTPYEVPQGYFEEFPDKLSARVLPRNTPFSVPTGYFDNFSSRLMERIKQEQAVVTADISSPLLDSIGKKMPFHVPGDYFNTLSNNILSALSVSEEIETLSPLMTGLKDKQVYSVPGGYFEAFPAAVLSQVRPEATPAKVIPAGTAFIGRRMTWLKYAAAAAITGLIITGGWLKLHGPSPKSGAGNTDIAQGLSSVSDQEIENYIDNHTSQIQEVQEQDAALAANSTAALDITDNDVKSFLGDVSDNELTEYLAEHGSPKDFPTN